MARRSINAAAALLDGFNAGYQTTGRVLRDIDVAKLAAMKPEEVKGAIDPAAAGADPMATAPSKFSFMGKEYASADDPAIGRARSLAMAGVMEKYGDVEAGQALRERIAAQALSEERAGRERELYPLQLEQARLGVTGAQRQDRMGARAEKSALDTDALNKDVGEWMKGRLVGPDGAARAATPTDYLDASKYRAMKLFEAGKADEAMKAMAEHSAAAFAAINLGNAERDKRAMESMARVGAGDIAAGMEYYNAQIPDGTKATKYTVAKDGAITFQRVGLDGKPVDSHTFKGGIQELLASINQSRDPRALAQYVDGEFRKRMELRQDARAGAQLGLAQAAAGRADAEFKAGATEREARAAAAGLRLELAKIDETTPEGRKRADQIEAKLQALATGQKGAKGAGADPAVVKTAQTLVAAGTYPDLATALDGVVNKPDQTHRGFVELAMKNGTTDPKKAVAIADQTMETMGWSRNGTRWSKAGGGAAAPAGGAPKKGSVVDGYVFQGGDPNDPKAWKKQ